MSSARSSWTAGSSIPEGRKTIEYPDIKERFGHFGLKLEWGKIERIRAIRNDLEHFYHAGSDANVREALADAATVIRQLLNLLGLDPVSALGQPCWDLLLRNKQLFERNWPVPDRPWLKFAGSTASKGGLLLCLARTASHH